MSEQTSEEVRQELYVLKNPYKEKLNDISILSFDEIKPTKLGLPIEGKVYTIPQNVFQSDYVVHSITKDITTKSISGNIGTLLCVQNNHTEILTYLVNILFNEISEPIKRMLSSIKNEVDGLRPIFQESQSEINNIEIEKEIILLRAELEKIKNEISKTNSNLEKLLEKI